MLSKIERSSFSPLSRRTMPALPPSSTSVQAKVLYQRLGLQRPSFWRGFAESMDCEPLTQITLHRSQGSRSFRADFEALRADRDQALSKLLNA
jgi:hypothetical protein